MWLNLGANLDEHSAERTAGTLESRQLVYKSVDRDCDLKEEHFSRDNPKEEQAVHQIISDLLNNGIFMKRPGRERYSACLLYTSPSPRDGLLSRMPSSA